MTVEGALAGGVAILAGILAREWYRRDVRAYERRQAIRRGELPPDPRPVGWVDPRRSAPARWRGGPWFALLVVLGGLAAYSAAYAVGLLGR